MVAAILLFASMFHHGPKKPQTVPPTIVAEDPRDEQATVYYLQKVEDLKKALKDYPQLEDYAKVALDDISRLMDEHVSDSKYREDFNRLDEDLAELKYQEWLYDNCDSI